LSSAAAFSFFSSALASPSPDFSFLGAASAFLALTVFLAAFLLFSFKPSTAFGSSSPSAALAFLPLPFFDNLAFS